MPRTSDCIDWLLDSDPALRWQVERDLLDLPVSTWSSTRSLVSRQGCGASLLSKQDADGQWAGGAYFPSDASRDEDGQPWTATTWSLNALREWGVEASALGDTASRLGRDARWEYDDLPYWNGEVDVCINAFTLANGAWLGADVAGLADWFVEHRLTDGSWNCEWIEGSVRSSVHSTLNALRGILEYEQRIGGHDALYAARKSGEEYLLSRHLMTCASTGELINVDMTRFAYPTRWRYELLKATDYFRSATQHDGLDPDPRLERAVAAVRAAQQSDGRWIQGELDAGRTWFDVDAPSGMPSRWLTLFGSRVLRWWDSSALSDSK